MKTCIVHIAAALGLLAAAPAARSAPYPDGPITMIVPFSAGGSTDILARLIGKELGNDLKASVIVENKPGAEGFIAARALKTAKPDGRTLMFVTTSVYAINSAIFTKTPYDPAKDFTTAAMVASSPNVFLTSSESPFKTLKQVLDEARNSPQRVSYATGATMHLLNAKWLEALSHTSMNGIPYKGSAAAYPDLVARRVDFMVDQPLSSMSFVQNGKLRVLAVTSEKRWPQMPDVPTVAEQGFPEFSTTSWWAVVAPAGTPADVVARINASVNKSLRQKAVQDTISQLGADVSSMTLQQAQAFTAQELGKWRGIANAAHVKLD